MSAAGFGSFMEGLQGGIGTGQEIRKNRQREKLYDAVIRESEDKGGGRAAGLESIGKKASKYQLDDPILYRGIDAIKGKIAGLFGGGEEEGAGEGMGEIPAEFDIRPPSNLGGDEDPALDPSQDTGVSALDNTFRELMMADGGYAVSSYANGGEVRAAGDNQLRQLLGLPDTTGGLPNVGGLPSVGGLAGGTPGGVVAKMAEAGLQDSAARKAIQDLLLSMGEADRRAAAASRRGAEAIVRHGTGEALEPGWRRALTAIRAPEGAGRIRRIPAAGKALGALGALAATNWDAWGTDTEDYRRRLGMETDDPTFLGDLVARAGGVSSDLANNMAFGQLERFYRDKQDKKQAIPVETKKPEKEGPTAPLGSPRRTEAMSRKVSKTSAIPAGPTAADQAAADPLAGLDLQRMAVEELPNFRTEDWEKFRNVSVHQMVANGMPVTEAMNTVDQQVMGMQIRGMTQYANQAIMRMVNGDNEGAQAFLQAAFKYMPSTTSIKTTVHNGHIIAMGYDEDTGEPVGKPWVVNPETLTKTLEQFTAPGTFAEWAQDRREFKLREQEAQARSDYMAANSENDALRAEILGLSEAATAAGKGGGAGGAKLADIERTSGDFVTAAQEMIDEFELEDPGAKQVLAAVMSQMYRRAAQEGRQTSANEIIDAARRKLAQGGLPALQRYIVGGQ